MNRYHRLITRSTLLLIRTATSFLKVCLIKVMGLILPLVNISFWMTSKEITLCCTQWTQIKEIPDASVFQRTHSPFYGFCRKCFLTCPYWEQRISSFLRFQHLQLIFIRLRFSCFWLLRLGSVLRRFRKLIYSLYAFLCEYFSLALFPPHLVLIFCVHFIILE